MYEPCAKSVFIWSTDLAVGPSTHAHPRKASVYCTLVELYISVQDAIRGRLQWNANKFVNIQCVHHNVFVQSYSGMKPVQGVISVL